MSTETVLDLLELGIVPQSARQLGQTLSPIENGSMRRLANGDLVHRRRPSMQKFQSAINFSDTYPPAFGGLWRGMQITVCCVSELHQQVGKTFDRPHVPGSIIYRDDAGRIVPHGDDETIAPVGATWVYYRPILVCLVVGWDLDTDEYGAITSASLQLLEA